MKQQIKQISLLLCLVFLIEACTNDKAPEQILPVGKMSAIMLDLQLAKSYNYSYFPEYDTAYPTERKERLKVFYQQIFELHHIDTATFFKSFRYYTGHPGRLKKIYKRMQDSLKRKMTYQRELEEKKGESMRKVTGDNQVEQIQWQKFFKTWHAFSDSLNRQVSQAVYPFI